MARKPRVEYPGAIYHVMNRGDRREPIFHDDTDREQLLAALGEACQKAVWEVHAFCLMPNHFYLVVETPQGNLVAGMQWLLGTYTGRFNRRHKLFGHLFSGRYKALIVDGSGDGYLKTVCDYVHLNPARVRLVSAEDPLRAYRWSSFPEYLLAASKRVPWLRVERLFGEYRISKDSAAGRREFEAVVEARRGQEKGEAFKGVRRGWCLSRQQFRQELLAQVDRQLGALHFGAERAESQEARAERLVQTELDRLKWTDADLAARRKGDPAKVRLARRLREETLVTVAWIARRLQMGSEAYLTNRLYLLRKGRLKSAIIGPDLLTEDGERIYVRLMNDQLVAVSSRATAPEAVWELDAKFGYDINPAALVEKAGVLFYGTKNGLLLAVDGKTGRLNWQHKLGNALLNTVAPLSAKQMLVTDFDGQVSLVTAE